MTKYFRFKGQNYKAVLWIASRTLGFSVVEWPDFEYNNFGGIVPKKHYHIEFSIQKIQNIDYYIEEWKKLQSK